MANRKLRFNKKLLITGSQLGEMAKVQAHFDLLRIKIVSIESIPETLCRWEVTGYSIKDDGSFGPVSIYRVSTYGTRAQIDSVMWEAA